MADYTKEEAIAAAWVHIQKNPSRATSIIDHLMNAKTFDVSIDEFNEYADEMSRTAQINILDQRAADLEDIIGFSQIDSMSDIEILRVFKARDELNARIDDIGSPPTDAEWFQRGLEAEQRIARLRPFYERKKDEEWEDLEYPGGGIISPFLGPMAAITELVAGATDWRYDFKEKLHEQGAFTSWNPLTGFGAWDIAEFKVNPTTGQKGFSRELLRMEDELERLYGVTRDFKEQYREGGWGDVGSVQEEVESLNQIIMENELLDPRLLGEI